MLIEHPSFQGELRERPQAINLHSLAAGRSADELLHFIKTNEADVNQVIYKEKYIGLLL